MAKRISDDPRFAQLERLIETADAACMYASEFLLSDPQYEAVDAAARSADNALDTFTNAIAAIRPQTLADMALQARAARYWHERLADNIEVTPNDKALVASILDLAGIAPPPLSDFRTAEGEDAWDKARLDAEGKRRKRDIDPAQAALDDARETGDASAVAAAEAGIEAVYARHRPSLPPILSGIMPGAVTMQQRAT